MHVQLITSSKIVRVLLFGFALVIVLLVAAAFIALENTHSIKESAASLVEEQLVTTRLIDEVQREQATFSAIFHSMERDAGSIDRASILAQLRESDQHIGRVVNAASGTAEEKLWRELQRASLRFTQEARRLLEREPGAPSSGALLRYHNDVIAVVARLIAASYDKASLAQAQIQGRSEELARNSLLLLGTCLVLALICAALTTRMTAGLLRRMEWQAGELARVSWQLLENQEAAARRFSHELHDELGQSLTAVKANLVALRSGQGEGGRLDDCERLVDESIHNVRELSQLLRPTILDDFGLDAGLRWLCDGFTQRTGIEVDYSSDFGGRLADETETHLFRIAQEALTNVARHSGARHVQVRLHAANGAIRLSIADDGRGLKIAPLESPRGLGMVGMRARARNAGGELLLRAGNGGGGVRIDVKVPARRGNHDDEENQNSARG